MVPPLLRITLPTTHSYTWASEVCAGDNEERALVIGSMNGFQYAVAAWLPIVTFPQLDAPTFRKGFPSTFGLVIASILCVLVIQWCVVRERRAKAVCDGVAEDERTRVSEHDDGKDGIEKPKVITA